MFFLAAVVGFVTIRKRKSTSVTSGRLDSSKKKKDKVLCIFKGGNGCNLAGAARIFFYMFAGFFF